MTEPSALQRSAASAASAAPSATAPGSDSATSRLKLLEGGVGEVGDLVVVAGEDDRVPGEASRAAVVVEVVEVGEEQRRPARVDGRAGPVPGRVRIVERLAPEPRPGELEEPLLEPSDPPVEEPRRRLAVE